MPPQTASITLDDNDPHFGDQVTFTVVVPNPSYPHYNVEVEGYQGDTLVYAEAHYVNGLGWPTFTLGATQLWTGGEAECQVTVKDRYKPNKVLASLDFTVAA